MGRETVIHTFKSDVEIFEFLSVPEKVDTVKTKYPPPRYQCRIDPISKQMIITDTKEFVINDILIKK